MRTTPFKLIALAIVMSSCGAVIVSAVGGSDPLVEKVAEYRQWIRVTREPVPVPTDVVTPGAAPV